MQLNWYIIPNVMLPLLVLLLLLQQAADKLGRMLPGSLTYILHATEFVYHPQCHASAACVAAATAAGC
jgi:hypothetical protein